MKMSTYTKLTWRLHEGNPLIKPLFPSPVIADPAVLAPDESPDRKWHLFAHSIRGIYHYRSEDGLAWGVPCRLFHSAMRPFILRDGNSYHLFYERTRPHALWLGWVPMKWRSHIECVSSHDCVSWSAPRTVLLPLRTWHTHMIYGSSVSNPCLVKHGGSWRLYYSASLVRLEDCGFNEPRYIGYAESSSPTGPFVSGPEPILSPDPSDPWCNLGAGAIKVYRADDGLVGFQNSIYIDRVTGHTGSAIRLMVSKNGIDWNASGSGPIIRPGNGWMRSHVYALDVKRDPVTGVLRLYFNARNDWHWTRGREAIGLCTGS